MIDHYVSIGGEDVSADCYGIRITQTMTTDSDPGKATINLVNRQQKYTAHWPPQATEFEIEFYNYTYKNPTKAFTGLKGHVTDIQCTASEAIVTGECGMGHLADALGETYDFYEPDHRPPTGFVNSKDILEYILSRHDPPITVNYSANVKDFSRKTYDGEANYQFVVNDMAEETGAVFYFVENDKLEFHATSDTVGRYDLDGYVINPEQTSSIMGYCNKVKVVAARGVAHGIGPASSSPSSQPIRADATDSENYYGARFNTLMARIRGGNATARDYTELELELTTDGYTFQGVPYSGNNLLTDDQMKAAYVAKHNPSISSLGELVAPVYYSPSITTNDEADDKAYQLLQFFKLHKDALTKPIVAGMAPPLQSMVGYTPFIPINTTASSAPTEYYLITNPSKKVTAHEYDTRLNVYEQSLYTPITENDIGWWGQVVGVVIEREIEYDADQGFLCTLTISPGLASLGARVAFTDIDENYRATFRDPDPAEI